MFAGISRIYFESALLFNYEIKNEAFDSKESKYDGERIHGYSQEAWNRMVDINRFWNSYSFSNLTSSSPLLPDVLFIKRQREPAKRELVIASQII